MKLPAIIATGLVFCASLAAQVSRAAEVDTEAASDAKPPAFAIGPAKFEQSEIEQRIRAELERPTDFAYQENELEDVVAELSAKHKIPIELDLPALTADGKGRDTLMVGKAANVKLRTALRRILSAHGLTYAVAYDCLLITTPTMSETRYTSTRSYPVADLVLLHGVDGATSIDFDALVELMTSTISPETWREAGGVQGEARAFQSDGVLTLVVTQTEECHEQIADLFTSLRATKDPAVSALQRTRPFWNFPPTPAIVHGPHGAPEDNTSLVAPANSAELVAANNTVAVELYHSFAAKADHGKSFVFSPLGVVEAVAPLYAGAAGATAEEFRKSLRFGDVGSTLAQLGELNAWLTARSPSRGHQLRNETRLLVDPRIQLALPFIDLNFRHLGLAPATLPQNDAGRRALVADLRRDAGGRIDPQPLIDALQPDARLAVFNVVDFEGRWAEAFPENRTQPATFSAADGQREVSMMRTHQELRYAEFDGVQVVRKPYGGTQTAGQAAFYVLLPPRNQELRTLETSLTPELLKKRLDALKLSNVDLALPKFDFTSQIDLTESLRGLGLQTAFDTRDPTTADFRDITADGPLRLSQALQTARIAVDERETRAAAMTLLSGGFGGAVTPGVIYEVRCDRPFLFLIRDETTGTILFLGRYAGPETAKLGESAVR